MHLVQTTIRRGHCKESPSCVEEIICLCPCKKCAERFEAKRKRLVRKS